ncbi:MAG: hypothetical protein HW421_64 [Ignavibacteria bacterium]|nr:hypothetical protein [Ignavibacteria bacterium]
MIRTFIKRITAQSEKILSRSILGYNTKLCKAFICTTSARCATSARCSTSLLRIIDFIIIIFGILFISSSEVSAQSGSKIKHWSAPVPCLSLNTRADEFSPQWNRYEKQLYFNSTESGFSNFYTSQLTDTGFTHPKKIFGDLNRTWNNQSYITFSAPDEAYFSTFRQSTTRSFLNIFHTIKRKNSWSNISLADSLNDNSFTSQPTVSPDGTFLIFASDRNSPGNDVDLWMALRQSDGSYVVSGNLMELNSPGNEITPFLATNDTLYFATNGQEGAGGYDIFLSVREDGIWLRPSPVDGINTRYDESDFITIEPDIAIFASDRPGSKGGLDLYLSYLDSMPASKESEIVTQTDISILSEPERLDLKISLVYSSCSILPVIFLDQNNNPLLNEFTLNTEFIRIPVAGNIDSSYLNMPGIITSRMRQYPEAKLIILAGEGKETAASKIITFFNERFQIKPVRMIVRTKKENTGFFELISEEPEIFSLFEIGRYDCSIASNLFNIRCDARPRSEFTTFDLNLIAGSSTIPLDSKRVFPWDKAYDLSRYCSILAKNENSEIQIIAERKNGKNVIEKITFPVNRLNLREPMFHKLQNSSYIEAYLQIASIEEPEIRLSVEKQIKSLKENLNNPTKIIIRYTQSETNNNSHYIEFITNLIVKNFGLNRNQISTENRSKALNFSNPQLSETIVEIVMFQ